MGWWVEFSVFVDSSAPPMNTFFGAMNTFLGHFLVDAGTEDVGADADHGGAALHGDVVVVGHAP